MDRGHHSTSTARPIPAARKRPGYPCRCARSSPASACPHPRNVAERSRGAAIASSHRLVTDRIALDRTFCPLSYPRHGERRCLALHPLCAIPEQPLAALSLAAQRRVCSHPWRPARRSKHRWQSAHDFASRRCRLGGGTRLGRAASAGGLPVLFRLLVRMASLVDELATAADQVCSLVVQYLDPDGRRRQSDQNARSAAHVLPRVQPEGHAGSSGGARYHSCCSGLCYRIPSIVTLNKHNLAGLYCATSWFVSRYVRIVRIAGCPVDVV